MSTIIQVCRRPEFLPRAPFTTPGFWTGNVWRLMAAVVADRPIGSAFPIACPPTGLGIGRLDELRPGKDVDLEAKLPTDWGDQVRLFNIIANTTNSIRSALNGLAQRSS